MPSNSTSKKSESGQQATVGVKAPVKSLQQLSSSGKAAQDKRDENRTERAKNKLMEAVENEAAKGGSSSGGGKK